MGRNPCEGQNMTESTSLTVVPASGDARLPATYEAACTAIAECARVDECKDWADKAAALASYYRQANDETMLNECRRIQGRAVRRAGELLKEFDGRPQNNPSGLSGTQNGGAPILGRHEAGTAAGMSRDQQVTAVRVANVPAEEFEAAIESATPPTVSALAEMGRKPRPAPPVATVDHLQGRDPEDFKAATAVLGGLSRFAEETGRWDAVPAARGLSPDELARALRDITRISDCLGALRRELESGVNTDGL
jgi:hypothetical protein